MSSNKRRKINENGTTEAKNISAFAARRQFQRTQSSESSWALPHVSRGLQDKLNVQQLYDGSLFGNSSSAAVILRSGLDREQKKRADDGLGQDEEMYDSPDQEETLNDESTEGQSRASMVPDISEQPSINLTNLTPGKANISRLKNNTLLIKLSAGERLVILGEFGLQVVKGQVTIMGATISASDIVYPVYAMASHSLPVIRFLACEDCQAEICISQHNGGLQSLKQLSPLFGKLCHDGSGSQHPNNSDDLNPLLDIPKSSFKILFSTEDAPGMTVNPLVAPPEWNEVISMSTSRRLQYGKPSSTMICGPKSSGKSTFARFLTNRLLSIENTATNHAFGSKGFRPGGIAFLDLDPGQPEYSPPGHISLLYLSHLNLGPPYAHPSPLKESHEVIRAHSIAALTPAADPVLYMKCVHDLLDHYRITVSSQTQCPLIINTPGWILGTGLEILVDLIRVSSPTEIIYMSQDGPANVVHTLKDAAKSTSVLTMPSQITKFSARTPTHLRTMQVMSYFHAKSGENGELMWSAEPLSSVPPWEVDFAGNMPGILGIMCVGEQPPPHMLKDTIDGTLLSIVVLDDETAILRTEGQFEEDNSASMIVDTPEDIPYFNPEVGTTLNPSHSSAIGVALLRGIDVKRRRLQLLTPIPSEDIQKAKDEGKMIVLISGKLDIPGWAYTEDLYKRVAVLKQRKREETLRGSAYENDNDRDFEDHVDGYKEGIFKEGVDQAPWVEEIRGDQGRGVAGRILRVRRDLGRAGDGGG